MDPEEDTQYVYEFVMDKTKQRFNERRDCVCPWCNVNCQGLYTLMKHLQLCHPRFNFTLKEEPPVQVIVVRVNDLFDGAYSAPDISLGPMNGPSRREVETKMIIYHPPRPSFDVKEFLEEDPIGPRMYYHSRTRHPMMPGEEENDSEDEEHIEWLTQFSTKLIDEFIDVDDGEKALMKLWNLHVLKHG